jgi:non-specific serine/threonine protein kinase
VWIERLEGEHDNMRAALRWSIGRREAESGLPLGAALWLFWYLQGHLSEGRRWLEGVLAQTGGPAHAPLRAQALCGAGIFAHYEGDSATATAYLEESIASAREAGDRRCLVLALVWHGIATQRIDPTLASARVEEGAAVARELADPWHLASALIGLGEVARYQGDYGRAAALYEESLAHLQKAGDRWSIALVQHNLGHVAQSRGAYASARRYFEESLISFWEQGNRVWIAGCLAGLAGVAAGEGALGRAARLFGASGAVIDAAGLTLDASDQADIERSMATTRAALGEEAFVSGWACGRSMPLQHAISYALERPAADNGTQ